MAGNRKKQIGLYLRSCFKNVHLGFDRLRKPCAALCSIDKSRGFACFARLAHGFLARSRASKRILKQLLIVALFLFGCDAEKTVTVSGAVQKPGEYAYRPAWKAIEYVDAAGGYTLDAAVEEARLTRAVVDSATGLVSEQTWWSVPEVPSVEAGDVILVPNRVYAVFFDSARVIEKLEIERDGRVYRVPNAVVVAGRSEVGTTAAVVVGNGEVFKQGESDPAGQFQYLYLRMHPDEYGGVIPEGKVVSDLEALEDAVEVHRGIGKRWLEYRQGDEVQIPPAGYVRVVAGAWPQPKTPDFPGPGMRKKRFPDGRVWTTFPDGRQRTEYPDGRVTVDLAGGGNEVRYADGRVERKDLSGNVEVRHLDGKREIRYAEGGQEVQFSDGRVEQRFKSGAERTLLRDGTERTQFADGTVHVKRSDGTVDIRAPKGVQETRKADGSVVAVTEEGHEVTVYPDGRRFTKMKDGTTIEEFADGRKVQKGAGGERVEVFPDGSKRMVFADGSEQVRRADGSQLARHADGTVLEVFASGRKVQTDGKGNRLEVFPDGREVQVDGKGNRLEVFPDGRKVQVDVSGNQVETMPDGMQIKTFVDPYRYWGRVEAGLVELEQVPEQIAPGEAVQVAGTVTEDVQALRMALFQVPSGRVLVAPAKVVDGRFTSTFADSMAPSEAGFYRLQIQAELTDRVVMAVDQNVQVGEPEPLGKMTLTVMPFGSEEEAGRRLARMIEQVRRKQELPSLELDAGLSEQARAQAWELSATGQFAQGEISVGAENTAQGPSVEEVHAYMMMSAGHRYTLLDRRWTHVGVAVAKEQGLVWVVELFEER